MKKIASILLCLLIIVSFSACKKEKYGPVKEQVIKQLEDGITDYKEALSYFKKGDHENKHKYLENAYKKFNEIYNITEDGNLTSLVIDDENYIYYYEHYYADRIDDIYGSNEDLYYDQPFLSYDKVVEEWEMNIDNMNKELDEYKLQEDRENIK